MHKFCSMPASSRTLLEAVKSDDAEAVKQLLLEFEQSGKDVVTEVSRPRTLEEFKGHTKLLELTPLMVAALCDHSELVKLLLDAGAAADQTTSHEATALMLAATRGHMAVLKALLEAGANVNYQNAGGSMPGTVLSVVMQDRFVVLSAIKHADDGNLLGVYVEDNDGALPVVGNAQAGSHVIADCTAMRKTPQALAIADNSLGALRGNVGRSCNCNVVVQGRKLFFGLRCKDNTEVHRALACSAARRARRSEGVTAREGSAFSAS